MQTKTRILHFLTVLVMGFFGIISLLMYELFQYDAPATPTKIPNLALWSVRLDIERLAKDEAYTVLFEARDESLLRTLQDMLDKRMEKNRENGPLTIDFRQDVVLFGAQEKGNTYIGIALQVIDPKAFKQNIGNYLSKGQAASVHGNQAFIITDPGKHTGNLQQLADRLLKESYRSSGTWSEKNPDLSFWKHGLNGAKHGNLWVDCFFEDQTLSMEGICVFDAPHPVNAKYSLKNKGLSITTSLVPEGFSDSIARLLPVKGAHIPALNAIVLDYQGTVIDNASGGMLVLPQMNLILEAKTTFSADSIWAQVPVELQGENRTIVMGATTYQLKQLDEKTVFIGLDTNAITHYPASLCSVKGSLKHLTNISSNSYLVAFMDMIPMVKAGKDFVATTKSIDFEIRPKKWSKSNEYEVKGRLVFNDNTYALNEILRLALAVNPGK